MKKQTKGDEGIIMTIIVLIVALIALKYYLNFDFIAWVQSPQAQSVISPAWNLIKNTYSWIGNIIKSRAG